MIKVSVWKKVTKSSLKLMRQRKDDSSDVILSISHVVKKLTFASF